MRPCNTTLSLSKKPWEARAVIATVLLFEAIPWKITLTFTASPLPLFCALLTDWLLLSPLKAGRAFYFETLTADSEAARFSLLFRYYRHGYAKALGWRGYLWGRRLFWSGLLCLPALYLLTVGDRLALSAVNSTASLAALAVSVMGGLLLTLTLLAVEVLMQQAAPIPYLLSYPGGLRGAVTSARRLTKGHIERLIVLRFPWSVRYQTEKARAVHSLLREKPAKNAKDGLQHRKKYGRIGR